MGALSQFIGTESMIWASDFPHSDAKYPGVVNELREHITDLPATARANLLGRNAMRLYGLRSPHA